MASLLQMQRRRTDSAVAREIIQDSEGRLRALSLVHSNLYVNVNSRIINLKSYLIDISKNLEKIFNRPDCELKIKNKIEELDIDAELAMRIGLVFNESVTNTVKHAFNNCSNTTVSIESYMSNDGGNFKLTKKNISSSNKMGVKLIKLIEDQLKELVVIDVKGYDF